MKIVNFGSLNIDHVYNVPHIAQAGETISSEGYAIFCGGKGLNQSIAAARAGATVYHAGMVGRDGAVLREALAGAGVNLTYLREIDGVSGHAVIQVNEKGQNCIVIYSGANGAVDEAYIDRVAASLDAGDYVLLQNEIAKAGYVIAKAHEAGARVVLNPSPITPGLLEAPLGLVDIFILNEIEGCALAGSDGAIESYADVLYSLQKRFARAEIVLTCGSKGAMYAKNGEIVTHGIYDAPVVDTTGAGDTFCGYFIAGRAAGLDADEVMRRASVASSIAVSRPGAAAGIPTLAEVLACELAPLGR